LSEVKKCTWVDCCNAAHEDQADSFGRVWASLCPAHNKELEDSLDPKVSISVTARCWLRAQGGAANALKNANKNGLADLLNSL